MAAARAAELGGRIVTAVARTRAAAPDMALVSTGGVMQLFWAVLPFGMMWYGHSHGSRVIFWLGVGLLLLSILAGAFLGAVVAQ